MLGSSRRGDSVEPVLSEAEGAARRKELDFLSIVSRLRWISSSALLWRLCQPLWFELLAEGVNRACGRARVYFCLPPLLFPGVLALLFVMFERGIETANHFGSSFEERLRFRFIYFLNVAAEMIDQFPEFFPNVRGMRPRIF